MPLPPLAAETFLAVAAVEPEIGAGGWARLGFRAMVRKWDFWSAAERGACCGWKPHGALLLYVANCGGDSEALYVDATRPGTWLELDGTNLGTGLILGNHGFS